MSAKNMPQVLTLIYIIVQPTVQKVFAHELWGYGREGEAMATGTEIVTDLFRWWEELM